MPRTQLFIVIAIIAAIFVIFIFFAGLFGGGNVPLQPAELEFWGDDDAVVWQPIFDRFRQFNPHISIKYQRFPSDSFEQSLLNRIAEGRGPDIFIMRQTWLEKHRGKIAPLPQGLVPFTAADFVKTFVDGVVPDLVTPEGAILGFPLFIDTPVLFYNKDIFNAEGIAEPPKTWEELVTRVERLTQKTSVGDVTRSGIALGTARNIEYAFEIASALLFQYGSPIIDRGTGAPSLGKQAADALSFYTSFVSPSAKNYSWTSRLPQSLDALAEGKAIMAIGFLRDLERIRAKNPQLRFDYAPFPQPASIKVPVVYGTFAFPAVSKLSQNQIAAWQLLSSIASTEQSERYLTGTGRIPARRDLIAKGVPSKERTVFLRQALIARTWPIPDEDPVRRIFSDAIESIVSRASRPEEAVEKMNRQLTLLIK